MNWLFFGTDKKSNTKGLYLICFLDKRRMEDEVCVLAISLFINYL